MPLHFRGRIISCNYPKSAWENRVKGMRERKKESMRENNHNTSTGLPHCVWKSITLTSPLCERCIQITRHLLCKVLLSEEGDRWKVQSISLKCQSSLLPNISYGLAVPHFPLHIWLRLSDLLFVGSWAGGFGWTLGYWTIELWVFLYKLWFWFEKGCTNKELGPLFPPCLLSMLKGQGKQSFL